MSNNKKLTIADCHQTAKERGGLCHSLVYINASSKYDWECARGHKWSTAYSIVRTKSWCVICAFLDRKIKQDHTIEGCKSLAKQKGGDCLSTEYVNVRTKYQWVCSLGHKWYSTHCAIKIGRWCGKCANCEPITIEDAREKAKSNGGEFLSSTFSGVESKYDWKCKNNHVWKSTYHQIQAGKWCPHCSRASRLNLMLADCHKAAESNGGRCLATEYKKCDIKMPWQCAEGHIWETKYNYIQQGSWCPVCVNYSKGQSELANFCRTINPNFEPNARPFLPESRLQLDIYYPELKKAIELDGDYWHAKEEMVIRDALKTKLCEKNGIQLLRIKYNSQWYRKKCAIGKELAKNFLLDLTDKR